MPHVAFCGASFRMGFLGCRWMQQASLCVRISQVWGPSYRPSRFQRVGYFRIASVFRCGQLQQAKLSDPRPLIYVCDLHGFVVELTEYLYKHSLLRYIEVYVSRVNAANAPLVVGALVDLDAPEDFIKQLLQAVRGNCSAAQLVEEVEKRNRLRLLLQWLEQRVAEGNQDPAVHNALAKIFIDTNR